MDAARCVRHECARRYRTPALPLTAPRRAALLGLMALSAVLTVAALPGSTAVRLAYAILGAGAFLAIGWRRLHTGTERAGLVTVLQTRGSVVDSPAGVV